MENIRRHFGGGSSSSKQAESHSVFHTDILTSSPAANVPATESKPAAVPDAVKPTKNCSESAKTPASEAKTQPDVELKTTASSPKPAPRARSVFPADQSLTLATAGQSPPWLMTSLQTYIDSVRTLCAAATRLADEFTGHLKESGHGPMAAQFREMLQQIDKVAVSEMAQLSSDVQACWQTGHSGSCDNSADNDLVARNLLRLLQAQYQFFHCATENITEFTRCQATNDLKSSLGHVTVTTPPTRSKNGTRSEGLNVDPKSVAPHYAENQKSPGLSSSVDSPSSLRKQLSSFFSKLSPKTVAPSSEGQSVFFVGLECQSEQQEQEQQQRKLSQPEIRPKPRKVLQQPVEVERGREEKQPGTGESREDAAYHVQSQPTKDVMAVKNPLPKGDTCIASQEELDTVINLLSCGTNVPPPVPAPRHANISKAVGSQRSNVPRGGAAACHTHRRSDSLTTAETVINKSKTNTWPTKLGQGFSLQDTMNQMYTYENLPTDIDYPAAAAWSQMPMEYDPAYMHAGHSPWAMDDGSGQRNWPYVGTADGHDYRGRHWSAIYDSSSCSDESSSTGEVPWMIGHDLNTARHSGQKPGVDDRATVRPAVTALSTATALNGAPEKAWSAKPVWTPAPPACSWAPDATTTTPGGQLMHPPPTMSVPWNEPARVNSLWQPGTACTQSLQTVPK